MKRKDIIMKILIACLSTVLFLFVCVLPRGLVASAANIAVDARTFPDSNFRTWIIAQPGWVEDGYLTDQAKGAQKIDVSYRNISDLAGIEYFTELTELICNENELTTLDVTKNTALTELNCNYNKITTLDVTQSPALTRLECVENQLTTLDVTKNPALTVLNCEENQLTTLDVTQNPELMMLYCSKNQLTTLDVSRNTNLHEYSLNAEDQIIKVMMTRAEGMWESSIALLNPKNLAGGITYADGKLRSASRDITETPFSVSTGHIEKLTGKIILEYVMPPSDYENVLQSVYSLFEQGCDVDDIMFQYDRLMLDVRGEEDYSEEDLQEQRREEYLNILRDIERDCELIRYKKLK
jgi:hypothetical protein